MEPAGGDCGSLHSVYRAAREGDREGMRQAWTTAEPTVTGLDDGVVDALEAAVDDGDTDSASRLAADLLFREAEPAALDGSVASVIGTLLYWFGFVASFVLFFRAHSREAVVDRLRWAYRTVGVDIRDTETVDGVERTTFRCPYRTLGADRYGQRHACHDVLDRVDDGYVSFIERHREVSYDRPRPCAGGPCCYSEVSAG